MITQVEVKRNRDESASNLLRRFSKRLRGSGVLRKARKIRFKKRPESAHVQKQRALKRMQKQKEIEQLRKLGKISNAYYRK